MIFNVETRVNEIALSNPGARRVLEDAGVDYCCGGGKSLHDACLHAGITTDEILKRLGQNSELAGPGDTEWTSAPLADLTLHIRQRHHQYVRDSIPRVRALLAKIREKHGQKHSEIEEIDKLFGDVGSLKKTCTCMCISKTTFSFPALWNWRPRSSDAGAKHGYFIYTPCDFTRCLRKSFPLPVAAL